MSIICGKSPHQTSKPVFLFESFDLANVFPEWKSPLLSADFAYIQAFKNLNCAKKKLSEKKKEAEFCNADMKHKWQFLKKEQTDFLSNIQKYNTFFMENERKSCRISVKIDFEVEVQKKHQYDIDGVKKRIEYLGNVEEDIETGVKLLEPYYVFLQEIAAATNSFIDVFDLINYYVSIQSETKMLNKLRDSVGRSEILQTQILHNLRTRMAARSEQNDSLFYFRKSCSDAAIDFKTWESRRKQLKDSDICRAEEEIMIKHSCDNIYEKLRRWKRIPVSKRMNRDEKLEFIINSINELRDAVEMANSITDLSDVSCKADSSNLTSKRMI